MKANQGVAKRLFLPIQLLLAPRRPLLIQLGLDLCALGPFLGHRGFRAPLLGSVTMMARIVMLGLDLRLANFTSLPGAARRRDNDCEDDQCADDYGNDRKG
jgi:hypothetical protein